MISTTAAFRHRLTRLTDCILESLDWNGVMVASSLVFSTLMCVDNSMEKQSLESYLNLYIYGIMSEEAGREVEGVYYTPSGRPNWS